MSLVFSEGHVEGSGPFMSFCRQELCVGIWLE